MIIAQAMFITFLFPGSIETQADFAELTNQLAQKVEWIDHRGSTMLTNRQAKNLLNELSRGLKDPRYSLRHTSNWKNKQCFKIIHITSEDQGYRVYFECKLNPRKSRVVTKIKVSEL